MAKKRRLTDLYKVGKTILINDDSGDDPVEIYVRKLNPVEYETALRRANIKRSRIIRDSRDTESELYQDVMSDVLDKSKDELIDLLISEEAANIRASVEAELGEQEEWSKNEYLQGLMDDWNDGAADRYAQDPNDEEASRTYSELKRFYDAVAEEVEARLVTVREGWDVRDDDEIVEKAVEKTVEVKSNGDWLREFRMCQAWLACKDSVDKKTPYFSSRGELDELETPVLQRILEEYTSLEVEVTEGKSLLETQDSSNSSEAPTEVAVSAS